MKRSVLILFLLTGAWLDAQESQLQADFRGERERLQQDCSGPLFKALLGCAQEVFTDHPLHIAVGSIAPQNGFGAGLAFVAHHTPNERWRLSWNADAIGSANASWRAGVYMKAIYIPRRQIGVTTGAPGQPARSTLVVREYPVLNLYSQSISLNTLGYYGIGPSTSRNSISLFGMQETITGVNAIVPVFSRLKVSLFGELNGRFIDIRGHHGASSPSIDQLYTEASAPGLTNQPAFLQLGEGVRMRPSFLSDHLQLNYLVSFQEFFAPGSRYSFERFTADLSHNFPLYRNARAPATRDFNGPDECSVDVGARCPPPTTTRNLQGSFGIRLLISGSFIPSGNVVPFYFQPTLGGSDINGNMFLGSYPDYRFRAPNLLLLRGSFEHSIWGPLGFTFLADEGKVAATRGDIAFEHLAHSFATGLTVRAGGIPQLSLLFAWGGKEGTHTIALVNTALLGGSARPSLY